MKPLYFLVFTLLLSFHSAFAQNIIFPDPNFKQALIDAGVDGGDGEISVAEAQVLTYLDVSNKYITDISGIEHFISLQYLYLHNNSLTSLDLTGLNSLGALWCFNNSLTSLDVSGLNSLFVLYCYDNSLTSLNVSGLNSLLELGCEDNSLTSLDVSGLNSLKKLICFDNSLISVDLRNTPSINYLDARGNPDLQCLVVDDPNDPPATVYVDQNPIPYTTEPCLEATFDGLEVLVDVMDIHRPTSIILLATLRLAEDGCNHGSKWKAISSLETFILMVQRTKQLGRLTPFEAELLTSNARELIRDIRSGDVACSGQPRDILDWFNNWFGFHLENPAVANASNTLRTPSHAVQNVYPNPTSGRLNFSQPNQQVVVYDMLSKVMEKAEGVDHIDMSDYQPGVYVIQLNNDNKRTVHRVVKR